MYRRLRLSAAAATSPAANAALTSTATHGTVPVSNKARPVMCTYTDQFRHAGTNVGMDSNAAATAAATPALTGSSMRVDASSATPYTNAAPAMTGTSAA